MIRNRTITNGIIVYEEIVDLDNNTITIEDHGVVIETRELTLEERRRNGPQPLNSDGVFATLNAVLGLWPLEVAANAVGLTTQDLINEAQGWAAAGGV